LLDLADGLHFFAILVEYIGGRYLLDVLARMKVPPAFSRVQNSSLTLQMTLLADAVARTVGQLCRIYDIRRRRAPQVISEGPWQRSQLIAVTV